MTIPATMRALRQTTWDGPQHLRLVTGAPVPVPGPGEVLIRVTAAGVNFGDLADGPKVLAELQARTAVGKLALLP